MDFIHVFMEGDLFCVPRLIFINKEKEGEEENSEKSEAGKAVTTSDSMERTESDSWQSWLRFLVGRKELKLFCLRSLG